MPSVLKICDKFGSILKVMSVSVKVHEGYPHRLISSWFGELSFSDRTALS
jgi:hypothetical protein